MKKVFSSIVALLLMSTVLFGTFIPITALTIDNQNSEVKAAPSVSDVPISERYHVIKNGYREKYDLQEGIFGLQSADQENINSVYFYSDGYFEDSPEQYNSSLSTMSLSLALSAFNANQGDFDLSLPSGAYSNLFRHAKALMSDIGIEEKNIFVNDGFATRPTENTVGMIMGAKEISIQNESFILLPIAVRGGDYESEWASNFTLGDSGESLGFSSAAAQVVEQVANYIETYKTFDIPSALNEGKVKFWVVGYSRGGAVANITAKRLTEIYGETGNAIYGYTFEAPGGGIDAAEVDEPWTHNGVYKNIHNVLNPTDFITYVPPKQMGFKRYGVDHYVPGTEAGEIKTEIYETPTGITVTTHSDNEQYNVSDVAYIDRREKMVSKLAAIESTVEFVDDFAIGKINIWDAIGSGKLFVPIEEGKNITTVEWIECSIRDLLNWAANGSYSGGNLTSDTPNKDYRDFYTANTIFAGEEYVTLEVALQNVLNLIFHNQYNDELGRAIIYRAAKLFLENLSVFDMISIIQSWDELSATNQKSYINKVWNALDCEMLDTDGVPIARITDFVEYGEGDELKKSVYTLSSFLFLFLARDYDRSPDFRGINATHTHLITLIYNLPTIILGHFPEVCYSWLCTYDENYSTDNLSSKYANKNINLIDDANNAPPEVEVYIDVEGTTVTLSLSSIIKAAYGVDKESENNGSAIYYAIYENGKIQGGWQLYRSPIVIEKSDDVKYTIKAFATRFEEKGKEITLNNDDLVASEKVPEPPTNNEADENLGDDEDNTIITIVMICAGVLLVIVAVIIIFKKRK